MGRISGDRDEWMISVRLRGNAVRERGTTGAYRGDHNLHWEGGLPEIICGPVSIGDSREEAD